MGFSERLNESESIFGISSALIYGRIDQKFNFLHAEKLTGLDTVLKRNRISISFKLFDTSSLFTSHRHVIGPVTIVDIFNNYSIDYRHQPNQSK